MIPRLTLLKVAWKEFPFLLILMKSYFMKLFSRSPQLNTKKAKFFRDLVMMPRPFTFYKKAALKFTQNLMEKSLFWKNFTVEALSIIALFSCNTAAKFICASKRCLLWMNLQKRRWKRSCQEKNSKNLRRFSIFSNFRSLKRIRPYLLITSWFCQAK